MLTALASEHSCISKWALVHSFTKEDAIIIILIIMIASMWTLLPCCDASHKWQCRPLKTRKTVIYKIDHTVLLHVCCENENDKNYLVAMPTFCSVLSDIGQPTVSTGMLWLLMYSAVAFVAHSCEYKKNYTVYKQSFVAYKMATLRV